MNSAAAQYATDNSIAFTEYVGQSAKPVTSITISQTSAELEEEGTIKLTATITPNDADNQNVIWASSSDVIATVDNEGNVVAVSEGIAVITATSKEGGFVAYCVVNVSAKKDIEPTKPIIEVESKVGVVGNRVAVNIALRNNPGIASATMRVKFDTTVMTLVEVKDLGNLGTKVHKPELVSPYTLAWANDTISDNITYNGNVVTLIFEISENADLAAYPIEISYNYDNYDIYNVDAEKVNFQTVNGSVTVIDTIIGDVNRDGQVNNLDRMVLTRHLADWAEYPADVINMSAADVNADGYVNNLDRMILTRHLADWSAYAELPYVS